MSWWPRTRQSPRPRSIWLSDLGATSGESFQRLSSPLILLTSIQQSWAVLGDHRNKGVARTYRCNI
jgi:hypothetical protein